LNYDSRNQFQVSFRQHEYDLGTKIDFSGNNAAQFYSFIKNHQLNWDIFDLQRTSLSRFNLYYSRNNKSKDKISGKDFLDNYQREFKQTNKNVSLEKNRKGWILKIGSRRSNNYSRIYETKNSLKFDHEMKRKFLKDYYLKVKIYERTMFSDRRL
jgi:DNA relaxase NicK